MYQFYTELNWLNVQVRLHPNRVLLLISITKSLIRQ